MTTTTSDEKLQLFWGKEAKDSGGDLFSHPPLPQFKQDTSLVASFNTFVPKPCSHAQDKPIHPSAIAALPSYCEVQK